MFSWLKVMRGGVAGERNGATLRGWLPKKLARETAFNRQFLLIWVALVFTIVLVVLGAEMKSSGLSWLSELGVVLASAFLGFCVSNWWAAWVKGDGDRTAAEKIDDKLEDEIQWIVENLKQIANSVSLLEDPPKGFLQATRFMLTAQLTAVGARIERMALEVDRLGYDSGAFLEEKKKRFTDLHARVRDLMQQVPRESGLQGMDTAVKSLIERMGGPAVLFEHGENAEDLTEVESPNVGLTETGEKNEDNNSREEAKDIPEAEAKDNRD